MKNWDGKDNKKINQTCKSVKIPIEKLLEEVKPVVEENCEIEYRVESNILKHFGILGLSRLWGKDQWEKIKI